MRHDLRLKSSRAVVFGAAFGLLVALSLGASARTRADFEAFARAERVSRITGGALTPTAFAALSGAMDPAAGALARRHDPLLDETFSTSAGIDWASPRPEFRLRAMDAESALRLNAALPAVASAIEPAAPFHMSPGAERRKAERCLTQAIYYEAALESRKGKEAVAQVVLNRVRDPNFPRSVCGVVFQGADLPTGCQFSFTCDGSMARGPAAWAWRQSQDVARKALDGHVAAEVGTATHYHADYVLPYWGTSLVKLGQIGRHIFYRWRGAPGEPEALAQRWSGREPWIDEARYSRPRAPSDATQLSQGRPSVSQALYAAGLLRRPGADVDPNEPPPGFLRVSPDGAALPGGRRAPTRDEVARINESLSRYQPASSAPESPVVAVAGQT